MIRACEPQSQPGEVSQVPGARELAKDTFVKRLSTLKLAYVALIGNIVVILQGAVVRATGSGAGCGSHWPTCNGTVVPLNPTLETGIEFSHRVLSLVVLIIGVWLLRRGLLARKERPGLAAFATLSFAFLVVEALVGAATVVLGMTGDNTSVARGIWVASHLVNSLLLIGALTGTVVYAREDRPNYPLVLNRHRSLATLLIVGLVATLVLMFSGGIAAMGNTIFPSESLAAGIRADFDAASHPLIRLRILHPLIAIVVGVYLFVVLGFSWAQRSTPQANRLAKALLGVYIAQLVIGTANLTLLAPIALQLLHLGVAIASFALLAALSLTLLGAHPVVAYEGAQRAALENI